jgi:glycogen phosphorylase
MPIDVSALLPTNPDLHREPVMTPALSNNISSGCVALSSGDRAGLQQAVLNHVISSLGRDPEMAGDEEIYRALALTMRDILVKKWIRTQKSYYAGHQKRVYYLSLEFLIGRSLGNSLINLDFFDTANQALKEMGYDLAAVREQEEDAALGNGGLGRLAACFMDSIATLKIPAYGYGINYEYGLFRQTIINGSQVEQPDNWLRFGTPWAFERTVPLYPVSFYGRVHESYDDQGRYGCEWVDTDVVMATACDILIPGYRNDNVINMRLWKAKASRELELGFFNQGDYIGAVEGKVQSETISKLLYPSDDASAGRELRLKQQYFFVAATFQDIFRRFDKQSRNLDEFPDKVAVHLNDTHPAIAIPELMRLFLDDHHLSWEKAFGLCVRTFAYTNHTLMPEALETWPTDLLGRVLPRHLQIIYEINRRFLDQVARRFPGDPGRLRAMSIIDEGPPKQVRMAHLAIVGSHSVNGVAALHTDLLKSGLFADFHRMYPARINNKTNGITPRRWLLKCNPELADLISETIGEKWITDLESLKMLVPYAEDPGFQETFAHIKRKNKIRLIRIIKERCQVNLNPDALFDIQVKRIHEYKRQLLNLIHVIVLYHRIIRDPDLTPLPQAVVFAGKAAPSYWKAKTIIQLIHGVAGVINNDPRVDARLRVVFIPDYGVSLAEKIIPAADLSEQISTAGTEASGTGNMKFALNGALTIGTLDGANIEIRNQVGADNFFLFGMTSEQVQWERQFPGRTPGQVYEQNSEIRQAVDAIRNGRFSRGNGRIYKSLVDDLLDHQRDPYLHLLDMEDYIRCQQAVEQVYQNPAQWRRRAILNVANMGKFSTDRTIREYAREIWGIFVA